MYSRLFILLIFFTSSFFILKAQEVVSLCEGNTHTFGVPNQFGSSYTWSIEDSSLANITSGNGTNEIILSLLSNGSSKLFVEQIDVNGCKGYDSISIIINSLPEVNIYSNSSTSICDGDSIILLTNNDFFSYLWNNNKTTSSIEVAESGSYYVTVIDSNGCVNSSNVLDVNVQNDFIADFNFDGVCINEPTHYYNISTISEGEIDSVIWMLDLGYEYIGDTFSYNYNVSGQYYTTLIVKSNIGCVDSVSKFIDIYDIPNAQFSYDPLKITTLDSEVNFTNTSSNSFQLLWSFGDSSFSTLNNPVHVFNDPGIYNVMLKVQDSNNCIDSVSKQIIVYYDFIFHVPNTFTVNDDGINDFFGPEGLRMGQFKNYNFLVYNKWGELVFKSDIISRKWDGKNAPSGVYSWVIIIEDELEAIRKEYGTVRLIR